MVIKVLIGHPLWRVPYLLVLRVVIDVELYSMDKGVSK